MQAHITMAAKTLKQGVAKYKAQSEPTKRVAASALASYQLVNHAIVKANPRERISMIRLGFDSTMLAGGSEFFNIPSSDFLRIVGVPVATANRKKRENAKLGIAASERLARIALIEADAEDVFGSQALAKQWLVTQNHVLGDAPLALLDTEIGAIEVKKVLAAIAYGGTV